MNRVKNPRNKKKMSAVAANPMGTVAKDKAYSNLFGTRINGLDSVVDFSNFKTLDVTSSSQIKNVTADTINGSSANIALTNCNPNELLATDAQTRFVSIPYGADAIANSVPRRSATEFTAFSQLFLTDTSNQITGNSSPNQVIINAVTPTSARIYSFTLESSTSGAEGLTVTSSATSNTSFLDPAHTINQIGLKSVGGVAQLNVNSGVGDSFIKFSTAGASSWSMGNVASDDHFAIVSDLDVKEYVVVHKLGATTGRFTMQGDISPPSGQIVNLGSTTRRFNSLALSLDAGKYTDVVAFTGVNITPGAVQTILVANPNVTSASCVLCQVEDFNGVYFTNGCPYALVTNVINGVSFDLNVFNLDASTTIGNTRTTTVRYWILP